MGQSMAKTSNKKTNQPLESLLRELIDSARTNGGRNKRD